MCHVQNCLDLSLPALRLGNGLGALARGLLADLLGHVEAPLLPANLRRKKKSLKFELMPLLDFTRYLVVHASLLLDRLTVDRVLVHLELLVHGLAN